MAQICFIKINISSALICWTMDKIYDWDTIRNMIKNKSVSWMDGLYYSPFSRNCLIVVWRTKYVTLNSVWQLSVSMTSILCLDDMEDCRPTVASSDLKILIYYYSKLADEWFVKSIIQCLVVKMKKMKRCVYLPVNSLTMQIINFLGCGILFCWTDHVCQWVQILYYLDS